MMRVNLPRVAPLVVLVVASILAFGCGGAAPKKPLTSDWPTAAIDDDDYLDVVDDWTRRAVIHSNYQEVLELAAILKSPEWRAAHASRDAKHRGLTVAARDQRLAQAQAESEGPWEFELMLTTWDRRENDLDRGKKASWRVFLLDANGNEVAPLEVVKDRRPRFLVRTEFPSFGDFAQPYVVKFPREANVLGPNAKQVRLRISSERGGAEVRWDAP